MKIAVPTEDYKTVAGHAGQASRWLYYEIATAHDLAEPRRIALSREQVFHHWDDSGPHPLDGVEVIVARSAGQGFLRRMQARGVTVLLTAETHAQAALRKVLDGEALPAPGWDATLILCRIRDLFSRH